MAAAKGRGGGRRRQTYNRDSKGRFKAGGGRPGGGKGWRTHNEDGDLAGKVKTKAVEVGRRAGQAADRKAQKATRKGLRRFLRWFKKEPLF